MKTAVLIASHIHYDSQLLRLDTCLESLCSQTIVPDIFVSISFANDTYKCNCATIIRKYLTVKFKLSAEQKFQMEHLSRLSQFINDYDMIMFCDDDDTYLPMRVELFADAFQSIKKHCDETGMQCGGVREIESGDDVTAPPEYWAYGIPPSLLIEFFNRIKGYENLMRHKFADIYLRNYLRATGGNSMIFATYTPELLGFNMYQYTITNPDSICAQHQSRGMTRDNAHQILSDNITYGLMCQDIEQVKKEMSRAGVPYKYMSRIIPNVDKINCLTKILYK